MLVVGRLHVATQLVRRCPKLRLEPESGAIVICLLCYLARIPFCDGGTGSPTNRSNSSDRHHQDGRPCFSYDHGLGATGSISLPKPYFVALGHP